MRTICGGVWRVAAAAAVAVAWTAPMNADQKPIDTARSVLTVYVYKSGLFSALADNHVVKAPIASGSISEEPSSAVEVSIHSGDLTVLDPDMSADRRADVQARMIGAEVLDVAKFPEITFKSTSVESSGPERWTVTGQLTLHGQARPVKFQVSRVGGAYRGEAMIKQRDFGIEPIRIAGGTVKVKDELKITFEIRPGKTD